VGQHGERPDSRLAIYKGNTGGLQGELFPPEAKADLEDLAQYILRNPFSVEKTTLESPTDLVIYRSRLNAKINRNFEVFTSTDFLAAITQHIPDQGAQMVRYYGWYSNKMRGVRERWLPPQFVVRRPGVCPPPLCQRRAMLGETQNQFSLIRAALSTGGCAKSKFSGRRKEPIKLDNNGKLG
jgi:hypothetical protein